MPAYVDGDAAPQRIVESAAVLPAHGAVAGWASLHWRGGRWFDGLARDGTTPLPVPLAVDGNRRIRSRPGIRIVEDWHDPGDIVLVDGLPVTTPVRAVSMEVRRARDRATAIGIIDMAAFNDLVSLEELAIDAASHLIARPGARRFLAALAEADENAWSPREVRMRDAWCRVAGFPRPRCNAPVFSADGHHLFTPDLIDPEAGVVGEYDGLLHLEDGRRSRDLNREEMIRDLRLQLVTMVSADAADIDSFVRRLSAAYRRGRKTRPSGAWTITPPSWWIDTSTVAARRALTEFERQLLLRRQRAA